MSESAEDYAGILEDLDTFSGQAHLGPQFRVQTEAAEASVVERLVARLALLISQKPNLLPEKVQKNDMFRVIFGSDNLHTTLGHRQLLAPVAPNEEMVLGVISGTAERIAAVLALNRESSTQPMLGRKLELLIRKHLRDRLVSIYRRGRFHLEKEVSFTPSDVEVAFHEINDLVKKRKLPQSKASTAVLFQLRAISREEIQRRPAFKDQAQLRLVSRDANVSEFQWLSIDKPEQIAAYDVSLIEEEIKESLHWASDFIRDIMMGIKDLIRHYEANGAIVAEENEAPNLNQVLRNKTPFEILDYLYNGDEVRDVNDAQILWVLGFVHFIQMRRLHSIEAVNKIQNIDQTILNSMFAGALPENKISYPTLKLRGKTFQATGSRGILSCRKMATSKAVDDRKKMIHLVEVDDKREKSRAYKYFAKNYGFVGPDRFPDEIRTRGILAGMSSTELSADPELQEMVVENLIGCAHAMGMTRDRSEEIEQKEIDPTALEPGDFCIEKDFSHPRYPKISLIGVTPDNIRVEIQLITIDTHAFEEADGSGMHHKIKEKQLELNMAKDLAPQSISEITHRVCNWELEKIEAHQKETAHARTNFMANNEEFFKMAA